MSLGSVARADDDASAAQDPHPTAGSLSLQLRYEDPTTSSDTGTVLGLSGFQLGLGKRVSDRVYVGATTELQLGMNMGDVKDGMVTSLRAGGEARYTFHQGQAAVSTNGDDGPYTAVPRFDYIGVRGGVQTVNGAPGSFGEFEIGGNAWLSQHTQLGLFLGIGINAEPADAYGTPYMWNSKTDEPELAPTASPGSTAISPYFTFAAELAFG